ncbi:unnamed protein product [Thelazia callipaeda]|uniref:Major sperm protein n=1 Tax=Thelazia callipaeda TaxID=103827 RepID=A0A0N5DB24_THECL|nr:unnamed protein product [Thelazia callipaeda]
MAESLLELSSKKLAKGKISDALSSDIASDVVKEAVTHEELIKKIEGLKFHIEPDLIHIDGIEEITNVHEITNENSFPIIFRVKVTHKNIFRVNPTNGIIGAKKTLMLKITRLGVAPRSDRFDVEALPYIEELLHLRKSTIRVALQDKVQWFFSFGYIPIVCSISYNLTRKYGKLGT